MLLCYFKYPFANASITSFTLAIFFISDFKYIKTSFSSLVPSDAISSIKFHSVTSDSTYSELIVTYLKSILNSKKVKPKPDLKIIYSYYFNIYISTLLKKSLVLGFLGLPNISSGLPSSAIMPPSIKSTLSDTSLAKPIS